jgi:hypothetical protein
MIRTSDLRIGKYYRTTSRVDHPCHFKIKDLIVLAGDGEVAVRYLQEYNGYTQEYEVRAHLWTEVEAEEVSILEGMVNVGI